MKSLDEFAANVKLYAPGCPDPTMYFALRQSAIEFCERTRMWRYEDEFAVAAEDCEAITAPSGSEIHEIEAVFFNGNKLTAATTSWLDEHMRGWRAGLVSGYPKYVTQSRPDTISIVPRMAGTLALHVFLKPSQDAEELPDWMADKYRAVISHGALGHILLIPNQSFTNPELGGVFGSSFQAKIDKLSAKGLTGQQRAPARTRATYF